MCPQAKDCQSPQRSDSRSLRAPGGSRLLQKHRIVIPYRFRARDTVLFRRSPTMVAEAPLSSSLFLGLAGMGADGIQGRKGRGGCCRP